ncbi:hypothetical protein JM80_1184 [Cellulophaga sp. RHA_52]|uniref:hypothetical protein n=1 Tax=Cellulophaga sp. RHA_52 TaxID=1250036 RepID=UPI001199BB72|nr:hypothetical protein [Cellulophaga sp. RHA_52]TVZ08684.1 hypothetical protein JM80_1184 [Cellulophaga sp. RHA_52]
MKVVIIIGIVLLVLVSVWYANKTGINSEFHNKQKALAVSNILYKPLDFGYKMVWIAVKTKENMAAVEILLNYLSTEFGEAHFFGTNRVVEYHSWMKSKNGKMERIYSYLGESMENIKVFGEPTKAEEGLKLFNSLSEDAKNEAYFEREDLTYADEMLVMEIAEKWGVNPTKLSTRTDIKKELGLAGK